MLQNGYKLKPWTEGSLGPLERSGWCETLGMARPTMLGCTVTISYSARALELVCPRSPTSAVVFVKYEGVNRPSAVVVGQ